METEKIKEKTIQLIDSLKAVCREYGLSNSGNEYLIITQFFLYKFLNDKFGYEAKQNKKYGARLAKVEKWDAEYDTFTEDEIEDLWSYLQAGTPRIKPSQTIGHLYNQQNEENFNAIFDNTMSDIADLNADIFSMATVEGAKITIFQSLTDKINGSNERRSKFAKALIGKSMDFNFESIFAEKYDFFSSVFEYMIQDYNTDGGGKYAEYYTPRAIATVMARLLVDDNANLKSKTCYDPSAGSGTLLMALAHQIGEDRCSIYAQDISDKSSYLLRLNLVLNNLVNSIQNVINGDTLVNPAHKEADESPKKFDYVVSNPPFKLNFSGDRDTLAANSIRFWAGVPKIPANKKDSMAIYTCFIQHVVNSIKDGGKGAIVIPTGFITAKSGVEKNILQYIVNNHIVMGVVSMPSNVFANTGTNVSVLFFDKTKGKTDDDKVILIDASKLGEEYKDANGLKKVRLTNQQVENIVSTFRKKEVVDDFSVCVSYNDIKEKGYSLSAGQYFDIKIEYVDITADEFNAQMKADTDELKAMFEESHLLEQEIEKQLNFLKFGEK